MDIALIYDIFCKLKPYPYLILNRILRGIYNSSTRPIALRVLWGFVLKIMLLLRQFALLQPLV